MFAQKIDVFKSETGGNPIQIILSEEGAMR